MSVTKQMILTLLEENQVGQELAWHQKLQEF
jgi:hypothetical protein